RNLARARRARRPARAFVGLFLPQKSNQETGTSCSECVTLLFHWPPRRRRFLADRLCSRQGPSSLPAHPSRVSRGKASALVRMVVRTQKGGGPEMNLARNWARWGRPSGPRVGAVVVWPHRVGMITGQTADGRWIVRSGNDGGRVRERPRSVAGAVFRITHKE